MWTLVTMGASCALGQATEVMRQGNGAHDPVNVSMTGAAGDFWFGFEALDPPSGDDPELRAGWWNTATSTWTGKVLMPIGDLANNGIYPTALTWGGIGDLYVVGKQDRSGYGPNLKVYAQDRDDFTVAAGWNWLTNGNTNEETVPHKARDAVLPEQHICWTEKTGLDQAQSKAKDASTWTSATYGPSRRRAA